MKYNLGVRGLVLGWLVLFTVVISVILSSSCAKADSVVDKVTWDLPVSCTMSSAIASGNEHTATLMSGEYVDDIGTTMVTVVCNDPNGLSVYVIGDSGGALGDTDLISNINTDYNIHTGVYTSGNSNSSWSMKLNNVSGTQSLTPVSDKFGSYIAIPDTWTKVAYRDASTGATGGSSFTTTYDVYTSSVQPAGSYSGRVKYVAMHPYDADAPVVLYIMQEVAEWKDDLTVGNEVTAIDLRDGKMYTVAKLADGNIWMTQNLDHDIGDIEGGTYTSADTDIPTSWTPNIPMSSWIDSYTTPAFYDPGDLYWNGVLDADDAWDDYWQGGENPLADFISDTGDSHYHVGNYYNWTAAVAMSDSSEYTNDGYDVDQSICPAGWMLPKSGSETGPDSFYYLISRYGWDDGSYTMEGSYTMWGSPLRYPLSGMYIYDGEFELVGNRGSFWSSAVWDEDLAYVLDLHLALTDDDFIVSPDDADGRDNGLSVRCVAR